jgi:Predicted acyltransferase
MRVDVQTKNNREYEILLNDLIDNVFGFSFAHWHELNLWDDRYESYSIIENGKILSNICVFKADLLINGEIVKAHQYGAVSTRNEYCGQGLSRILMEYIYSKYPDIPAFLFANSGVVDFYPRFGFKRIIESRQIIWKSINNNVAGIKLSFNDERLQDRKLFSNIVDCTNAFPIQMFHMLMEYQNDIYFIENCDTIVIAQQNGNSLYIADIITNHVIDFDSLCEYLPFSNVEYVEFGFSADCFGITGNWQPIDDDFMFVRGDIDFPCNFKFPCMSMT